MLLDHRSVRSLAFVSCFERDELTAEAAEIDAARDMEMYLGFARDTGPSIRGPHVADLRADISRSPPERQARFKDQPISSSVSGGTNVSSAFDDDVDWDDDVHFRVVRFKAPHQTGLTAEHP